MIILGIDPGTRITGYGIIRVEGNRFRHVDNGCIIPPTKNPMEERLGYIFAEVEKLVRQHDIEILSLEKAFFAKNAASALKLGQCRGAIMVVAHRAEIPLFEYSPNEVKQAVTGSGRAQKDQMQKMIKMLLGLPEPPQADAADALAVALCHGQRYPLAQKIIA